MKQLSISGKVKADRSNHDHGERIPPRSPRRGAEAIVGLVVPIAVGIVVTAVLVVEGSGVDEDLQLIAPKELPAGQTVALRAIAYAGAGVAETARLYKTHVRVTLRDRRGRLRARATLAPSATSTMQGELSVPRDLAGRATLTASAFIAGTPTEVVAPVRVRARPQELELRDRSALPLQHLALGPLAGEPWISPAGLTLDLRVPGGACVPERRCDLLSLVGTPAAIVRVERTRAVDPLPVRNAPAGEQIGVVPLAVITHGPETEIELVAFNTGRLIARRTALLPLALGGLVLRLKRPILAAGAPLDLEIEADRGAIVIVDAFASGEWRRTGTMRVRSPPAMARAPWRQPLEPGLWRVQARTDPYSTSNAAVRLVYVRAPDEGEALAMRHITEIALRERWVDKMDPVAATLLPASERDALAAYMLAPGETRVVVQPEAVRSRPAAVARFLAARARLRTMAIVALALAALVVSAVFLRRGLEAASQARAVMTEAGVASAQGRATRLRMTLVVVSLAAAVGLAVLAVTMFVLARGGLP